MRKKPLAIMLIGLTILFGLVYLGHMARKTLTSRFIHQFQQQATVISTTLVKTANWNPELAAVGTLTAVNGVNVSSEVNGMVVAIRFKSGQLVKQGDVLVQLDDSVDQQTLNTNSAQLNLDKVNYSRQIQLAKTHSNAQQDVDQAQAKLQQSQAAVATAQVYVDKKKIRAPFSGKIGISQVNLGQYLTPGQDIATLQAMDPLFVDFSLPEKYFTNLYVGQSMRIRVDAYPQQQFFGHVDAFNSTVDVNTRTISIRGVIPNKDMRLYPGMFARVNVMLPQKKNVLVIPQTAVAYSLYGDSTYVVVKTGTDQNGKPILHAKQRFIKLGAHLGNQVIVLSGLKEGEEVVNSGQLKLQPDTLVTVNNTVKL